MQKHAIKRCQEYAKPAGGDITLTVRPCWPIRSLKKKVITGYGRLTMCHKQ